MWTMTLTPLSVYSLSVVALFLKAFLTIAVQARERLRARVFRYAEDAGQWRGTVGQDSDLCQRAERLLRNDAETELYYLALGGLLVVVEPNSRIAPFYFVIYVASRAYHAYWMFLPRQPHRNRAFGLG